MSVSETEAADLAETSRGKVISPSSLAHVVFRTANYQVMIDFWTMFLGATVVYKNNMIAFLTYDDGHHRIAVINEPGAQTQPSGNKTAGMHHVAFTFSSFTDLMQSYKQRKALGVLPTWCVNHGPTTSLYYKDPDGNNIETQVDNFDNPEDATAFMKSALFEGNPVGTDFDPEELDRKMQSGINDSILKKRIEIGPRSVPV
jgi:catechol 2,3-dioxygenase-like lactoylglutathione lyase family enzyme